MRNIYSYGLSLLVGLLALYILSCQEEEELIPLQVTGVEQANALILDTITIRGVGFSPGAEYNRVYFPGVKDYVSALLGSTDEKLIVPVPQGAESGQIKVSILNDKEVGHTPPFTILQPLIESIVPDNGLAGDTVVIYGKNFRSTLSQNIVQFLPNTTQVKIISGTSEELKVIVPFMEKSGEVKVLGSAGFPFSVTESQITAMIPDHGVVGDTITLIGVGLPFAEQTTAMLNTTIVPILTEKSTIKKVLVTIPKGATDGNLLLRFRANSTTVELKSPVPLLIYPHIDEVSPLSGISGTSVTIKGTSFSRIKSENVILFNGVNATVTGATESELIVTVPEGFTTGPISIEVNGRRQQGPVFSEAHPDAPVILSISPNSGPVGSYVLIAGKNFSTTPADNIVKFGSLQATVTTASETRLTVRVPDEAVTSAISITRDGKTGFGPRFTVNAEMALPFITDVSPSLTRRNTTVIITGGNFNSNPIVTTPIGNQLAVVNASATRIEATVPASFPAGSTTLYVVQSGLSSNQIPFTVYSQPVIASLSITEGAPSTQVVLTGTDFSVTESDNIVKFGTTVASIVNPADAVPGRVTVFVPDIAPGTYDVTLTVGNTSNALPFRVKEKPVAVKNIYVAARITESAGSLWKILKSVFTPPSISLVSDQLGELASMAADFTNNKVYGMSPSDGLVRSNMDNTGRQVLFTNAEMGTVYDFTLDVAHGKVYWTNDETKILSGRMDGTGSPSVLYNYENGNVGYVLYGISYNESDDMLYTIEYDANTFAPGVSKMKADGTGSPINLFNDTDGLSDPRDVRVDTEHGKLFIVDTNTTVYSGNADGSGTLSTFLTINSDLIGIALDIQDQYVYWGIYSNGVTSVYRKRYDGAVIPGTDPAATQEKVYNITGQFSTRDTPAGLVIEESTNRGGSQRVSSRFVTLKASSGRSLASFKLQEQRRK